jgi:hypothetical protein
MPKKKSNPQSRLLEAMRFLSLCQKKDGNEAETYCRLTHNSAVAFNSTLAIGSLIEEDIEACPHTASMILALERCGDSYSITQLNDNRLLVRSGDFQAFVPCCDPAKLSWAAPDAAQAAITDALTGALKLLAPIVKDKAPTVLAASILLRSGSAIATNRVVIVEAWHGCNLPAISIPKAAATAILKSGKKVAWFGLGANTATFGFDDQSWIRTNLFKTQEDMSLLLDKFASDPREIKPAFFEAVRKIAPFSKDGLVYCGGNETVSSHRSGLQLGGELTLMVEGGLHKRIYSIDNLKLIEKYVKKIDENAGQNVTMFFGDNIRGAIWHDELRDPIPLTDDDIPF